jgi:GT2 family glycosyltransferase
MAVDRHVFFEAGGFDPAYFIDHQEIDLCWRIRLLGYKILSVLNSIVYHYGGAFVGGREETVKGSLKICAYDEEKQELEEIISSGHELQLIRIPGIYWHGFKVIGRETALLLYFTNRLYDYENPDEERRPWNDKNVVPKKINGRSDDPRCNKPWDWFAPPHK